MSTVPSLEEMASQVVAWALSHLETLPEQPVGKRADAAELMQLLHEPAPEGPTPFAQVLERFASRVAPFAFRPNHPRFLAFIPSAPSPVSILGDWLAAACNFFAGVWLEASGPTAVELAVLGWFRDLLGMPARTSGLLTGGGSSANLTALVAARERLAREERGRAVMYVSEQRHWSLDRAAHVAGFFPEQVRAVECDDEQRMDVASLARHIARDREAGLVPWLVAANAGTTNTGAIDPLPDIAEVCRREGLWLHVDAAYGWASALVPEGRAELAGIEAADSVTLDPHKWLATGFDAGALLVRDPQGLERAFRLRPEYMKDVEPGEGEVNFCDRGIDLSRRFRALKIWLPVQVHGLGWYRSMVRHTRHLARFAAARLAEAGFEVASPPRLSLVGFRWPGSDERNLALTERIRDGGEMFLSTTRLRGRVVLRMCFVNYRTSEADVLRCVDTLEREARHLAG